MKKIAIVIAVLFLAKVGFSQDDSKKFRFGLKIAPAINWLSPDNTNKFSNGGSTLGFQWGLKAEYNLSPNFAFFTGLEVFHESGNIKFNDIQKVHYYMSNDFEFVKTEEVASGVHGVSDTNHKRLNVTERKFSSTYINIPVGIKMKTKQIGYLTYFGEFGLNLAIRTGTKVDDKSTIVGINPPGVDLANAENVNLTGEMQPIRVQLKVGLGAEYEISKGTAVFGGIHYNLGFTNVVDSESNYLLTTTKQKLSQKFTAHGISLSVGVLF